MKQYRLLFAGLLLSLAACKSGPAETIVASKEHTVTSVQDKDVVALSAQQVTNAGITLGKPEKREMYATLKVNGVVDVPPQNIVSISMPMGGYLKRMDLIPGKYVQRGSILATLEDPSYIQLQQDYLTARSRLQFLQADYARQKDLNATKATSDKVFQQVQSEYSSQRILLRSLGEKLRLIGIRPEGLTENSITRSVYLHAPINGYVSKVNVNIGKYVAPTDVLFELINPADLHVRLTVFENDAARLFVGQKVVCSTNSKPGVTYNATVRMITPSIGDDRATEVHCHLDGHGRDLLPGTFLNAAIELDRATVTAVPEEAVIKWENQYFVFSEEAKNQFRLTPVITGTAHDGFIEVKSALPPRSIVTKNAYTLLMKMKNSGEEG
ncbi:MAG TPA: efflux RND transporter periplasmic adaptor subunit [Flavisolibacter sp.]|nr:efflux RND transporter periplasmic adaptor subunit [Flavisolibacter sp.]